MFIVDVWTVPEVTVHFSPDVATFCSSYAVFLEWDIRCEFHIVEEVEYFPAVVCFVGSVGKVGILKIETTINQAICAITPDTKKVSSEYLYYLLLIESENIIGSKTHRTQDHINQTKLVEYQIPVIVNKKEQEKFIREMKGIENKS